MSIAKIDVAIAVLKSETEMPSGSAPRIAVVQDAVLTKRQTERILCNCSQCNGTKLTPARFESHTGSRRKTWKLIVKVKGTDIKLDNLLNGKKPGVAKTTQRNAPITMKQKVEELLQEQYMPVYARRTTEMCAICQWIEDWDYNKIIICNRCQVAVHQECYGARDVNDLTSWVCRACEEPQEKRNCCLCPIKGGALKRTDAGDFWVHIVSAQMTYLDPDDMEPAVGVLSVPLDSFKKLHTYVSHGKQTSRFDSYCPNHGDVNKSNALVLCTEEIVFSSMRSQRNNARSSCLRLVKRDTENQSTSCPKTDLPSTSSEEACARCRVYQKTNRKIIEYRGERIRCSVSDAREARYGAENEGCYFFRISEEFVLDATRKGNIARLINHLCQQYPLHLLLFCLKGHFGFIVAFFLSIESIHVNYN